MVSSRGGRGLSANPEANVERQLLGQLGKERSSAGVHQQHRVHCVMHLVGHVVMHQRVGVPLPPGDGVVVGGHVVQKQMLESPYPKGKNIKE